MLLKGERPKQIIDTTHTYFTRFFKTDSTSLLTRLLGVTVITALVVYTLGDKNRVKVKEILQIIKVLARRSTVYEVKWQMSD